LQATPLFFINTLSFEAIP